MKTRRILSFITSLALTVSMFVMPMTAKAATSVVYERNTETTSGSGAYYTVNLDNIFKTGRRYNLSWNIKPEDASAGFWMRADVLYGNVASQGNFGFFLIYDSGKNGMFLSDYNKLGNVSAYTAEVPTKGVDMSMDWDTNTGIVKLSATFPTGDTKTYNWNAGIIGAGQKYGSLILQGPHTAVTVSDFKVVENPDTKLYEKAGDWTISGEHNYLTVSNLGINKGGKYKLEFGVKAPTGNPCFFFDWRDYANNTKSNITSWNYKAVTGIYDDGNNDCIAIGPAPSWVGTVKRDGGATSYDYTIIWDTATGKFNTKIEYITANGSTGILYKECTGTGAFASNDVLKFATGSNATIKDLTISNYYEPTIYTAENGWTLGNFAEEQADGKLQVSKTSSNVTKFKPNLEKGKIYEITYDVSGLEVVSGSWRKPFTVALYAGSQTESDVLTYRQAGAWRNAKTDAHVVDGSNGQNKIIINTKTGDWEAYALGALAAKSGQTISANGQTKTYNKIENIDDLTIGFYGYDGSGDYEAPYISNVKVREYIPREYYYVESATTTGNGNIYLTNLDNIFETGNKYLLSWNVKPLDTSGNQWIRADILYGNVASHGTFGFFLLYDAGVNAMFLSDFGKIGKVADYTAEVGTKGVDMTMLWDTATGLVDLGVTFPTGKTYTTQWNAGVIGAGQKYGQLGIQGPHTAVTVSDLKVMKADLAADEAPVLKDSDITLYAGAEEQNAAAAGFNTDKITVDFGQYMNSLDMADDVIYVVDKATGEKVACEYSYAEGVYTMEFDEEFVPGKTYTVKVLKARNDNGQYTENEYEKDFVIKTGCFADLVSITQNGVAVEAADALVAGDAKINISYKNTEGTTPTLYVVVAYYNGEQLVWVDSEEQKTEGAGNSADFAVDYTVPTLDVDYDEVQIMVLDGFTTLRPLSDTINLK